MKKEKKSGFLETAAVMAMIVLLSKVLGLLRDILVANTYGTTAPAVAYETASRLPVLIFDFVIGGVVAAAFIPVFSDLLVREGKPAAMRYAASYVNLIFVLTGILTLGGVLFASPLVNFLAPDLSEETKQLAVLLTRIMFPMVICTGLAYSFVGILQSMGEFRIPALMSLASNLLMVGYLVIFGDRFGVVGLSVAMLCGWGVQALVQIPKLRQFGFRPSLRAGIFSPDVARSLKMTAPILIGTWMQPICSVINTRFTSAMENGRAVTAFGYANRLYTILVGVFSFVATNLLFPYFSRAAASGDRSTSHRLMVTSLKTLSFIIAPIAVGLSILAEPIAAILYERGEFTASDTALTGEALRWFAVGMLFMAVNEVLVKAFFAEKQPKLPMATSLVAMACNFGLALWLSRYGIGGVALASGLAVAIQCVLNLCLMKRKNRVCLSGKDWLDLGKSIAAAGIMGGAVLAVQPILPTGNLLRVLLSVLVGMVVYAVCAVFFRSEEAEFLLDFLRNRKKKRG